MRRLADKSPDAEVPTKLERERRCTSLDTTAPHRPGLTRKNESERKRTDEMRKVTLPTLPDNAPRPCMLRQWSGASERCCRAERHMLNAQQNHES